jgi:hypothetical protein
MNILIFIAVTNSGSVAARSVAGFCGRSLHGIAGSNPAWDIDVCFLCVLYGQVVASASG